MVVDAMLVVVEEGGDAVVVETMAGDCVAESGWSVGAGACAVGSRPEQAAIAIVMRIHAFLRAFRWCTAAR